MSGEGSLGDSEERRESRRCEEGWARSGKRALEDSRDIRTGQTTEEQGSGGFCLG